MGEKMVAVDALEPGAVLANEVLSFSGRVLLGKDVVLTTRHIRLLSGWDIHNVFVYTEGDETVDMQTTSTEEETNAGTSDDIKKQQEYFQFMKRYTAVMTDTARTFDFIKKQRILPVKHLAETAGSINSNIAANSFHIMNYLLSTNNIRTDFVSAHSVLVSYYAGIIARLMMLDEKDAAGVALAGLLHDVGNVVANRVVDPRAQANLAAAAEILKSTHGLSSEVILGIIQHREPIHSDGAVSGLRGTKIHPYARIIGVADFFHNVSYTNEHNLNPFPALDALTNEMFNKLDSDICQIFINRVKDSLMNIDVMLSDGQPAKVIFFRPTSYTCPVVKTANNEIIDLSQRRNLIIKHVLMPSVTLAGMAAATN